MRHACSRNEWLLEKTWSYLLTQNLIFLPIFTQLIIHGTVMNRRVKSLGTTPWSFKTDSTGISNVWLSSSFVWLFWLQSRGCCVSYLPVTSNKRFSWTVKREPLPNKHCFFNRIGSFQVIHSACDDSHSRRFWTPCDPGQQSLNWCWIYYLSREGCDTPFDVADLTFLRTSIVLRECLARLREAGKWMERQRRLIRHVHRISKDVNFRLKFWCDATRFISVSEYDCEYGPWRTVESSWREDVPVHRRSPNPWAKYRDKSRPFRLARQIS